MFLLQNPDGTPVRPQTPEGQGSFMISASISTKFISSQKRNFRISPLLVNPNLKLVCHQLLGQLSRVEFLIAGGTSCEKHLRVECCRVTQADWDATGGRDSGRSGSWDPGRSRPRPGGSQTRPPDPQRPRRRHRLLAATRAAAAQRTAQLQRRYGHFILWT